ncbi:MAG: type I DNA topoisomerase [Chlorobiota bacterium]|nr:type I DNA topoisomerase [Chlorobiota bacterium]QQS67159.1 MAG: type I DNA topoisomerase [Chlorobiota bacterium]
MKNLVIVESPSKAKTINSYLGSDYIVDASVGHIKDLPKDGLGVDIENGFIPEYCTIKGKGDVIKKLIQLSKHCDYVFLATDPDREGEAIAQHIKAELKGKSKKIKRVTFNEITKDAVIYAIQNPRDIDKEMVASQEARRVMDRLIGYKVSPFLWRNMDRSAKGLSAGRVQSVALRIIVERERIINSFLPIVYFNIIADFVSIEKDKITATLIRYRNQEIKKPEGSHSDKNNKSLKNFFISDEETANRIRTEALNQSYKISNISQKEVTQNSPPPFITSTLQQDASRKLRMNTKRVMQIAQKLYEGVLLGSMGSVGLITYMRTDSIRINQKAEEKAEEFIYENYGKEYLKINVSKKKSEAIKKNSKKNVQDAHEAIRPTNIKITPKEASKYLDSESSKLYELIWQRFIASQMSAAIYDQTLIEVSGGEFLFRAEGKKQKFQGWMKVYSEDVDESKIIEESDINNQVLSEKIKLGLDLNIKNPKVLEKKTQSPPRFTQSSLVKELERLGIGRPSTYSSILSLLIDREYIIEEERKLKPTVLGFDVCDLLTKNFPEVFDTKFTNLMEKELDLVALGEKKYIDVMKEFYKPLEIALLRSLGPNSINFKTQNKLNINNGVLLSHLKGSTFENQNIDSTGIICNKCGGEMIKRNSKLGNEFYGCKNYPECTNTKQIESSIKCPKCQNGSIVERKGGKFNSIFYGCTNYPECKYTSNNLPK